MNQFTKRRLFNDSEDTSNVSVTPLQYKVLVSGGSLPIAATNAPYMVAGQIWTLEIYDSVDNSTIDFMELVSGVLYAVGSKYRMTEDFDFSGLDPLMVSTFSWDGAPYIVSTDSSDILAPFVNTLGGNPVLSRSGVGQYLITLLGAFPRNKTSPKIYANDGSTTGNFQIYQNDVDSIEFTTAKTGTFQDDLLSYTGIEIDIYP